MKRGPRASLEGLSAYPRGVRLVGGTAGLFAFAALVGGCGGTITKRDFVARADAICATAVRDTRSIAPPGVAPGQQQQLRALGKYLAQLVPIVQSQATQIQALRRPAEDAHDRALLARFLAALAQIVSDYRKLAAAANRGDAPGVSSAEAALRANPVASLAAGYGLSTCGTSGATVA